MSLARFTRSLGTLLGALAVLGGGYIFLVKGLPHTGSTIGSRAGNNDVQAGSDSTNSSSTALPRDVPNSVLQQVSADVSVVPGVEEVYVNSDKSGGYDVSGTVNVAGGAAQSQIDTVVSGFLKAAYGSKVNVKDVQVYVMQGGNIVAGAGLGADVYKQLTTKAGVSNASIVGALQGFKNNVQGVDDKWFQYQNSGSP